MTIHRRPHSDFTPILISVSRDQKPTPGELPFPNRRLLKGPYPVQVEIGKSHYCGSCGMSANRPISDGSHKTADHTPAKLEPSESSRALCVRSCASSNGAAGSKPNEARQKTIAMPSNTNSAPPAKSGSKWR
jgi:CDGSH iron-sulfur domain-containing protein 3